ncbi:MAG: Phosphate binding protein [Desulfotomaculum sp. 46_80]|nr:MAG: Phosphate binding protein [Desulfotomaculum sp. 46_80]
MGFRKSGFGFVALAVVGLLSLSRDAVAIVVNSGNPVTGLNIKDVADIYSGRIDDWSEVGGNSGKITVIARAEGSSARSVFEKNVMNQEKITTDAIFKNSNSEVQEAVSHDASAIGFVSLDYTYGLRVLALNGIECNMENCLNGSYLLSNSLDYIPGISLQQFERVRNFAHGQQNLAKEKIYLPV